ncbi:MAG: beta-ketoacyl-ACP synthase III [Candidatus Dormibacteria bacterium]
MGSVWRASAVAAGPVGGCRVLGLGTALPSTRVSNADLERFMETSDEWIASRTGIQERRVAGPEETLLDLAARSARACLGAAGVEPGQVDTIICSSSSPDETFPSLACRLQAELGCPLGPAFDLQAACSGAVYGLALAQSLIQSGLSHRVLVVAAEIFSRLLDWSDRSTAILFGDGAGAFLVGDERSPGSEILALDLGADGRGATALGTLPAPLDSQPSPNMPEYTSSKRALGRVVTMNGREVFRFSTKILEEVVLRLAESIGVGLGDIALVVPHQANSRILATAAGRLKFPVERFVTNLERTGNTSSASIPLALAEAAANGVCRTGDLICLVAFGAGLTWGGLILRWGPTAIRVDDPATVG